MSYDSTKDTLNHIERVKQLLCFASDKILR